MISVSIFSCHWFRFWTNQYHQNLSGWNFTRTIYFYSNRIQIFRDSLGAISLMSLYGNFSSKRTKFTLSLYLVFELSSRGKKLNCMQNSIFIKKSKPNPTFHAMNSSPTKVKLKKLVRLYYVNYYCHFLCSNKETIWKMNWLVRNPDQCPPMLG